LKIEWHRCTKTTHDIKHKCWSEIRISNERNYNFVIFFLDRGPPPRWDQPLFLQSLVSSVSFSRCDDNDSAEREQSSSIRLLMRVIIEPGSPVLIMRFRICRSENEHPRCADTARRYYVPTDTRVWVYACVRVCVYVHSHARANARYANISA